MSTPGVRWVSAHTRTGAGLEKPLPGRGADFPRFFLHLVGIVVWIGPAPAQIAGALRIPQSVVSRMESGERRADFIELIALADIYGQGLNYFVRLGLQLPPLARSSFRLVGAPGAFNSAPGDHLHRV